jgi:hypothetical protein
MRPFAVLAVVSVLGSAAVADRTAAAAPAQPAVPSRPTAPSAPPAGSQPAPIASPASSPEPSAPLASRLTPVDPSTVPEACQPLAKQALVPGPAALSARISLAVCMADRAVAPLALCDCGESILAVDTATEPALALLDEVIDVGDPASQMIAEHAEGELHAEFAVRLLATLPALQPGASADEIALREMRRQTLDAQLEPWRDAASRSFQHVVELARSHPELADRPAIRTAVRDSQQRLRAPAAS